MKKGTISANNFRYHQSFVGFNIECSRNENVENDEIARETTAERRTSKNQHTHTQKRNE